MAIVYRFILKEVANDILKNGISLSDHNYDKKSITAFLNPKDCEYEFNSNDYIGIKIDVPSEFCKIIDASEQEDNSTSIDYEKYKLGTFKNPEVLITTSIAPDEISVLNKDIDIPVLYSNSRDLYYSCKVSEMLEEMSPKEAYVVLKNYFSSI